MDIKDIIESLFSEEFINENNSKMNDIISYVQKCTNEFVLDSDGIEIETVLEKIKDNNTRIDNEIKFIDNGLKVTYVFKHFWELIKQYIPKSITKISLPLGDMDISILKEFPNLRELEINDYKSLEKEELDFIFENTNIKKIVANNIMYNKDNLTNYASTDDMMVYKDILIKSNRVNKFKSIYNTLNIRCDSFDTNLIETLLKNADMSDKVAYVIQTNNATYSIKLGDNKDIDIEINDSNLNIACDLYDYYTSLGYNINSITFSTEIRDKDYKKNKIMYTEYDYTKLDELNKKTNLNVAYDASFVTRGSYDEFRGLTESIRWYRQLITTYNLSPLEKVAYAYDIMKTFEYNESKKDKSDSRKPHRIIETGNIVCAGYTAMLEEILYGIDENIKAGEFGVTCYEDDDKTLRGYHSRSMINIDDDKYNVHGIYALDATWDSFKSKGQEVLGDDYDALSLYHFFMIPFTQYEQVFKHDTALTVFQGEYSDVNANMTSEELNKIIEDVKTKENDKTELLSKDSIFAWNVRDFLDNIPDDEDKVKCFDSRRLSFPEFLNLIRNVRMAEGYSGPYLEDEIQKIERINAKYYGVDAPSEFVKQ